MRNVPEGWPGTGEPPQLNGKHAAPYTIDEAAWLQATSKWLESKHMDARRRSTCKKIAYYMLAHIERNDSLPGGRPFASVSKKQLANETHRARETVANALEVLTAEGGPLSILWEPQDGQRIGACYRFDMPDNSRALSDTCDVPDNSMGLPDTSGVCDVPNNSTDVPDNSTDVPDNSLGDSRHSNPIPSCGRRVAPQTQRDAPTAMIDTNSTVTWEEYQAMMERTSYTPGKATTLDRPPF